MGMQDMYPTPWPRRSHVAADESPCLVIGPLLRRVVGARATVWVETDRPTTVRVRAGSAGGEAPTFTVHGHHYALVLVDGLEPDSAVPYEVFLADTRVWPEPDWPLPPSVI